MSAWLCQGRCDWVLRAGVMGVALKRCLRSGIDMARWGEHLGRRLACRSKTGAQTQEVVRCSRLVEAEAEASGREPDSPGRR